MIRRLGILFVLALAVTACTGSERDAVTVGDESISRAELVDLLVAVNPGGPDELPATLSADALRQIASTWTQDAAVELALEEQSLGMTNDERADIDGQINEAIQNGNIGSLDPMSGAYEALRRNVWVGGRAPSLTDVQRERIEELASDAGVESRLGQYDPESGLIVAH